MVQGAWGQLPAIPWNGVTEHPAPRGSVRWAHHCVFQRSLSLGSLSGLHPPARLEEPGVCPPDPLTVLNSQRSRRKLSFQVRPCVTHTLRAPGSCPFFFN